MEIKKQRDFGIEVLRIIAMFMIILHHFSVHGQHDFGNVNLNLVFNSIFAMGGKIGVDIFVFITGYFSLNIKVKFRKVMKLVLQVCFFSILTYLMSCLVGYNIFNLFNFFKSFFPFIMSYGSYWFIVIYMILYLCTPFLNKVIINSNQFQLLTIIILFSFLWIIMPYLNLFAIPSFGYSELGIFILLYFIGAYLRLYSLEILSKRWFLILMLLCIGFLMIFSKSLLLLFDVNNLFKPLLYFLSSYNCNSPMVVLFTVFIFFLFKNFHIKYNKILAYISASTFGVYLIHDSNYLRDYIWNRLLNVTEISTDKYFCIYALTYCIIIFTVCSFIEIIRQIFIERPFFNSYLYSFIEKKIYQIKDKIKNKCKN